jgi:hypothetical protein
MTNFDWALDCDATVWPSVLMAPDSVYAFAQIFRATLSRDIFAAQQDGRREIEKRT